MVQLTKIYTRTGDSGRTHLSDLSSAAKTDLRIEAYGHVDEANSVLGIATARADLPGGLREILRHIQNELFDVGADLSTPIAPNPPWEPLRIIAASIERLEAWCDQLSATLAPLNSFILPGGTETAAHLHVARTVVRRAERAAWRAVDEHGVDVEGGLSLPAITYLNRLSDLLFLAARVANASVGDVRWIPAKDRTPANPKAAARRRRIEQAQANEERLGRTSPEGTPPAS